MIGLSTDEEYIDLEVTDDGKVYYWIKCDRGGKQYYPLYDEEL